MIKGLTRNLGEQSQSVSITSSAYQKRLRFAVYTRSGKYTEVAQIYGEKHSRVHVEHDKVLCNPSLAVVIKNIKMKLAAP